MEDTQAAVLGFLHFDGIAFLSSGGLILTSKVTKYLRTEFTSFSSKWYSWAIFSAVHVSGESLWLLRSVNASTTVTLPLGMSMTFLSNCCPIGSLNSFGPCSRRTPASFTGKDVTGSLESTYTSFSNDNSLLSFLETSSLISGWSKKKMRKGGHNFF